VQSHEGLEGLMVAVLGPPDQACLSVGLLAVAPLWPWSPRGRSRIGA